MSWVYAKLEVLTNLSSHQPTMLFQFMGNSETSPSYENDIGNNDISRRIFELGVTGWELVAYNRSHYEKNKILFAIETYLFKRELNQ